MDILGPRAGLQTLNRYTSDAAVHLGARILTDTTIMIALVRNGLQDIDLLCTTTG